MIIRRYRVQSLLEAEDMASIAMIDLWRQFVRSSSEASFEGADFTRIAQLVVKRTILSELTRARARKRGGDGADLSSWFDASPSSHRSQGSSRCKGSSSGIDFESVVQFLADRSQIAEEIAAVKDQIRWLGTRLDNPDVPRILDLKLKGFTIDEIARDAGTSKSTVERLFRQIREAWAEMNSGHEETEKHDGSES
jgi:RNA polymerase sigma factor (sigma-70 family)